MAKKNLALSQVYKLLEPGPVVMVTTARKGRPNVMTMSWLTMMDFEPPIVGIIMGEQSYSFGNLKATKECVINIPAVELAKKVVRVGNTTGAKVDKFKIIGLTPVPAVRVKPPLIKECFANFECKVIDARMAAKYNFFVLEVLKAWIDPSKKNPQTIHHQGNGNFIVDGKRIKLRSGMK